MSGDEGVAFVPVTVTVTVLVDPADEELWDAIRAAPRLLSFAEVIKSEIRSNLESVPYVRHIAILRTKGGDT